MSIGKNRNLSEEGELLNHQEYYLSLPHDMSGSMSKNRFRMELLWGISKMLDVYDIGDFTMVFDCACDIEIHIADGFEFYQIKTHNGRNLYTCTKLTAVKGEGSILGKLYMLKKDNQGIRIKLAVVSNSFLSSDGRTRTNLECCFDSLSDEEKNKMSKALRKELNIDHIDLSNLFFIHTDMNLADPKNEIIGKIVTSFQKIKKCEPINPNALYRLIYDTVVDKACYEYNDAKYESIIEHKGITKAEFDNMLDVHVENARTGIKQTEEFIDNQSNIKLKREYKKALPKIMKGMCSSQILKHLEKKIGKFLVGYDDSIYSIDVGIDLLIKKFHNDFPIEFDNAEKIIFYVIIINRFIEGVYDE